MFELIDGLEYIARVRTYITMCKQQWMWTYAYFITSETFAIQLTQARYDGQHVPEWQEDSSKKTTSTLIKGNKINTNATESHSNMRRARAWIVKWMRKTRAWIVKWMSNSPCASVMCAGTSWYRLLEAWEGPKGLCFESDLVMIKQNAMVLPLIARSTRLSTYSNI